MGPLLSFTKVGRVDGRGVAWRGESVRTMTHGWGEMRTMELQQERERMRM